MSDRFALSLFSKSCREHSRVITEHLRRYVDPADNAAGDASLQLKEREEKNRCAGRGGHDRTDLYSCVLDRGTKLLANDTLGLRTNTAEGWRRRVTTVHGKAFAIFLCGVEWIW